MKRAVLTISLMLVNFSVLFAQKNIVTVPMAEPVEKGKTFFQAGATLKEEMLQLSMIFDYGLKHNFYFGFTFSDVTLQYGSDSDFFPIEDEQPDLNPDALFNIHKAFKVKEGIWLGLGTLSGVNISREDTDFSSFNYLNSQFTILGDNILVLGAYFGNNARMNTPEGVTGIMAGVEIPLIDFISLSSDYISGDNTRSVLNTGLSLNLTQQWSLYFGAVWPGLEDENAPFWNVQFSFK